ncbi:MAG: ABC transporter permease [Clostridia bacterium]|nr:ABC transporter permease [Clostridia bacterium]
MNSGIFRLSFKNVVRGRSRVMLSVLSVAVGIAALLLLYCVGSGGGKSVTDMLRGFGFSGALIVPNSGFGSASPLYAEDADYILDAVGGVEKAIAFTTRYGVVRSSRHSDDAVIWGVGYGMEEFIDFSLLHGTFLSLADIREGRALCVIDRETAYQFFGREDAVGCLLTVGCGSISEEFEVAAVTDGGMSVLSALTGGAAPLFVYIPGKALSRLTGDKKVAQLAVKTGDESVTDRICRALNAKYDDSVGYTVQDLDGYMGDISVIMQLLRLLLLAAASISLLVSGIGIMNAMYSSVKERRREIGLCLAMGASPAQICFGFLAEATLITFFGGILGTGAGLLLSWPVAHLLGIDFMPSAGIILAAVAFVVIIGLIFGTLPALKASRLIPVETLREE